MIKEEGLNRNPSIMIERVAIELFCLVYVASLVIRNNSEIRCFYQNKHYLCIQELKKAHTAYRWCKEKDRNDMPLPILENFPHTYLVHFRKSKWEVSSQIADSKHNYFINTKQ